MTSVHRRLAAFRPPRRAAGRRFLAEAENYLETGDTSAAVSAARRAIAADAALDHARQVIGSVELGAGSYTDALEMLHERLQPRRYLEIGTSAGTTFALARPSTQAVGVDPEPTDTLVLPERHRIYAETSDEFFARHPRAEVFDGPVDLTFLDGMHLFEFALRDFINAERWAAPHGIILLHDTCPFDEVSADRRRHHEARGTVRWMLRRAINQASEGWTGDIWRVVLILRVHRPDLRILTLPLLPTGLTVVTNLDPTSTVLADGYAALVDSYRRLPMRVLEIDKHACLGIDTRALEDVVADLR